MINPPVAGMSAMRVANRIRSKLQSGFNPVKLNIIDDSARHAGHAGARPEGETHFTIEIVSPVFTGLGRIERQRRVYAALAEELAGPVHALSIVARSPEEENS